MTFFETTFEVQARARNTSLLGSALARAVIGSGCAATKYRSHEIPQPAGGVLVVGPKNPEHGCNETGQR